MAFLSALVDGVQDVHFADLSIGVSERLYRAFWHNISLDVCIIDAVQIGKKDEIEVHHTL